MPAAGNVGRLQYAGRPWFPSLGLYYYRARMYNPALGRFMQPDPLRYGDGLNLYAYARNDPINLIDPSGLAVDQEIFVTVKKIDSGLPRPPVFQPMPPAIGGSSGGSSQECNALGCTPIQDLLVDHPGEDTDDSAPLHLVSQGSSSGDYCGASGSTWIPDQVGGADLRGACARHDACYSTPGASKTVCDVGLFNDVFIACMFWTQEGGQCTITAFSYWLGVTVWGIEPFQNAQRESRRRTRRGF